MTAPLFSPAGAAPMIDEYLSGDMCERYGLVDATVVARLVDKARRLEGRMAGEREEMALIGALTLQMLARDFIDEFGDRARAQRALLERAELHVFEDRVSEPSRADSR